MRNDGLRHYLIDITGTGGISVSLRLDEVALLVEVLDAFDDLRVMASLQEGAETVQDVDLSLI